MSRAGGVNKSTRQMRENELLLVDVMPLWQVDMLDLDSKRRIHQALVFLSRVGALLRDDVV